LEREIEELNSPAVRKAPLSLLTKQSLLYGPEHPPAQSGRQHSFDPGPKHRDSHCSLQTTFVTARFKTMTDYMAILFNLKTCPSNFKTLCKKLDNIIV